MSDFVLEIIRADDLLKLRLEFTNLVLDPDETVTPRRLVRVSRAVDAFMTVFFPPQHLSEFNFIENSDGTLDRLPHVGHHVRVSSAGESRLGFRLRSEFESLSLILDELLDWTRFDPVLAVTEADLSGDPNIPRREVASPASTQTAIELPFRMLLSPEESGRWVHSARPVNLGGRIELWHTQFVASQSQRAAPQLWAIWSPDIENSQPNDFPMSLTNDDREQIVRLSSDFTLLDPSNFLHLSPEESKQLELLRAQRSQRLAGERLMLSALGGWLRACSAFNFPTLGNLLGHMMGHEMDDPDGNLFSLEQWTHTAVMGRDQYVRVVKRGFMFPFGHRAELTHIVERKFKPSRDPSGEKPAFLSHRVFLSIQEIERSYETLDMPFQSVRMTCPLTSMLRNGDQPGSFIPKVGDQIFAFPVSVTDRSGATIETAIRMVFVPDDQSAELGEVAAEYQAISRVDLRSQSVAFADGSADAVLKAIAISFGHESAAGAPPFRPLMREAEICLPIAEEFLGAAAVTRIAYDPAFVRHDVASNVGDVFANILDPGGLRLALPADKIGGVAAPNQTMRAISRTLGAVPELRAIGDDFAPANLDFLNDATILGVISMKDALDPITKSSDMPKFAMVKHPDGREINFTWKPRLKSDLPPPLVALDGQQPELDLNGSLFRPSGSDLSLVSPAKPMSDVSGTLKSFGLDFLETVRVNFTSLEFHTVTGQKPHFGADIRDFQFLGQLAFINRLSDCLPKQGFSSGAGPTIALSPEGVTAAISLEISSFSAGAFVIQNIAFSAQLSLFFLKPAELRFALSSRAHPFLMAYSLFGGGGFCAITISTANAGVQVEAALEFGAVTAIDLFVAKGEANAMIGVYFSIKEGKALLEGFIRLYGCVEVLQILTISVELYLSLSYDGSRATGTASITVMVRVLMFSKSLTLTITRSFDMNTTALLTANEPVPHRSFAETVSPGQWMEYCTAFAPEA